jgi:hypothetical protein
MKKTQTIRQKVTIKNDINQVSQLFLLFLQQTIKILLKQFHQQRHLMVMVAMLMMNQKVVNNLILI